MLPVSQDFMLDALFLASLANNADTIQLLTTILEIYKEAKEKNPNTIDEDYEVFFDIIRDIVELGVNLDKKAEVSRIILKIKKSPLGRKDPSLMDQVSSILTNSQEVSEQRVVMLFKKLQNWVVMSKTTAMLRKMMAKSSKYNPIDDTINDVVLTEISEYARDITQLQDKMASTSATIDMVDFSDSSSIARAMELYKNKRVNNVMPTGLKALNRMMGPNMGFVRGESWLFCASSHNYKTGILMSCADWCCTLASVTTQPGMLPCVILISLENEVPENTMEMVRRAYVTAYKKAPPKDLSDTELVQVVQQYYNQRGIKFLMYRFDEYFGFQDFVKLVNKLQHKGLEVVAAIIDYIGITNIEDKISSKNAAQQKQENVKHFCNFCKRNDILLISGWQLGTEADMINSSGSTNVVKRYGASCLGDCRGVRREVDGLIWMYIERNHLGVPYLTMAWNKHRDTTPPKKEDAYAAWRFAGDTLGIIDDHLSDTDLSVKNIYDESMDDESDGSSESILDSLLAK